MHVHDIDVINSAVCKPESVSCLARNVIAGGGYDMLSTNYRYLDGKVLNAQADWTLQGDYGFDMQYRVNFEHGNAVFQGGELKINPNAAEGLHS